MTVSTVQVPLQREGGLTCLINAVTGQVKFDQIHMSGNATNQELASLCLKANAALNRPNQKNQIDLDGPAVGWEYLVCANRLLHAGDCGMESFASLSPWRRISSGSRSPSPRAF